MRRLIGIILDTAILLISFSLITLNKGLHRKTDDKQVNIKNTQAIFHGCVGAKSEANKGA